MIGIFDSGAGGLSVWKEIIKVLPSESYYYISDSEYCPYGPKSKKEIAERAIVLSEFLIERGAEIIVVACNTATAAAIDILRQRFDIPFVGMEPAVKPAAKKTKTGVIGVLATRGTLHGQLYINTSEKFAKERDVKVVEEVGDGLVELVEQGKTHTVEAEELVKKYTDPMLKAGADCVVLGCTHYPFLEEAIKRVSGNKLEVINPAPAVAKRVTTLLSGIRHPGSMGSNSDSVRTIATTGPNLSVLKKMCKEIVGELKTEKPKNYVTLDL